MYVKIHYIVRIFGFKCNWEAYVSFTSHLYSYGYAHQLKKMYPDREELRNISIRTIIAIQPGPLTAHEIQGK